jgi:nitrite reductase (NADH) large subunit
MGLQFYTGAITQAIMGDGHVSGVQLQDGRVVEADMVVVSAGIRSRVELARGAQLEVNRGIVVDEQLRTSVRDVYAAGDAAEFDGQVYGIIPAAIEQARAAAANMVSDDSATYRGTLRSNTLKVVGIDLTCLGDSTVDGAGYVILRYSDLGQGVYKRFALCDGKTVGAILLGDVQDARTVQQLIAAGRDVSAYGGRLLDGGPDLKTLAQG